MRSLRKALPSPYLPLAALLIWQVVTLVKLLR